MTTRSSGDHRFEAGMAVRHTKAVNRGLNHNFNRTLKKVFKEAAASASARPGRCMAATSDYWPEFARLTIARKIASIVLAIWKKEVPFDPEILNAANA